MAELKTLFSIYEEGKKLIELPDVRTRYFSKFLAWLLYNRLGVPETGYYVNYDQYITERFLFAFGTGTTPAHETDSDLESPIVLDITQEDRKKIFWQLPRSDSKLWGKYWKPSINDSGPDLRLHVDLPGSLFVKSGYQNAITEVGVYIGIPLGWFSFKRKAFTWWWTDYQYDDYTETISDLASKGLLFRELVSVESERATYSLSKYMESYPIELTFPYSNIIIYRNIPRIFLQGEYRYYVTVRRWFVRILIARVVLPEPIYFEPGYYYSFRYTIFKY